MTKHSYDIPRTSNHTNNERIPSTSSNGSTLSGVHLHTSQPTNMAYDIAVAYFKRMYVVDLFFIQD